MRPSRGPVPPDDTNIDTPVAASGDVVIRRRRRLLLLLIGVLSVLFGMCSDYGFITRLQLEQRKSELTDSIQSARTNVDSLFVRSKKLRYDTLEIERLAREKYGLARPGEQVFIVRKPSTQP